MLTRGGKGGELTARSILKLTLVLWGAVFGVRITVHRRKEAEGRWGVFPTTHVTGSLCNGSKGRKREGIETGCQGGLMGVYFFQAVSQPTTAQRDLHSLGLCSFHSLSRANWTTHTDYGCWYELWPYSRKTKHSLHHLYKAFFDINSTSNETNGWEGFSAKTVTHTHT